MTFKLAPPPAFDFDWMLGFLGERAIEGLEETDSTSLSRILSLDGHAVRLQVAWIAQAGRLAIEARGAETPRPESVRRAAARFLDLDAPLDRFLRMARQDADLAPFVAKRPGLRLPLYPSHFEGTVRAVVGQLISVAAARKILGRLVCALGERPSLPGGDASLRLFPTPGSFAAVSPGRLGQLGLIRSKSAAIQTVCQAIEEGRLDFAALARKPAEEAESELKTFPGIGPWTASYIRMRALGDRDAFPASDLGIRKAIARLDGTSQLPDPRRVEERAEKWRPWRAYAALHLWNSLAEPPPTPLPEPNAEEMGRPEPGKRKRARG